MIARSTSTYPVRRENDTTTYTDSDDFETSDTYYVITAEVYERDNYEYEEIPEPEEIDEHEELLQQERKSFKIKFNFPKKEILVKRYFWRRMIRCNRHGLGLRIREKRKERISCLKKSVSFGEY